MTGTVCSARLCNHRSTPRHTDTRTHGHTDTETQRHRDTETQTAVSVCGISPLIRYSWATHGSENADVFGASCSSHSVFFHSSNCSSIVAPDPLLLPRMPLILYSSCRFSMMQPDAPACRTATCSSFLIPGSSGTSPAPRSIRALFFSRTRFLSAMLALYVFILGSPAKVLSIILPIRSRNSSLRGFVAFHCQLSNAYP